MWFQNTDLVVVTHKSDSFQCNTNAAFVTIRILGVTTLDIVRANTFVAEAKVKIQHFQYY